MMHISVSAEAAYVFGRLSITRLALPTIPAFPARRFSVFGRQLRFGTLVAIRDASSWIPAAWERLRIWVNFWPGRVKIEREIKRR
jgi:hypothetical protein